MIAIRAGFVNIIYWVFAPAASAAATLAALSAPKRRRVQIYSARETVQNMRSLSAPVSLCPGYEQARLWRLRTCREHGGGLHGARAEEAGHGEREPAERGLQQGHGSHVGVAHEEQQ